MSTATQLAGLCLCGCGQETVISPKSSRREGWTKGEPRRYVKGHNGRRPLAKRFWEKVEKTGSAGGCWLWIGSRSSAGYGTFNRGDRAYDYAHRLAYELLVGPIPAGLVLDHLCRNRACVNPDHLEAVEHGENVRRGAAPYGPIRTTCKHGHDITNPANVYTDPAGGRRCRPCATERRRAA